jgi:hypothetical protein
MKMPRAERLFTVPYGNLNDRCCSIKIVRIWPAPAFAQTAEFVGCKGQS